MEREVQNEFRNMSLALSKKFQKIDKRLRKVEGLEGRNKKEPYVFQYKRKRGLIK